MFSHLPLLEKAKYVAAFFLALTACGWVGVSREKPVPLLNFEELGPVTAQPVMLAAIQEKAPPKRSKKELPAEGSIALSSATSAELEKLPGVGPATAKKILDYRQKKGGFRNLDQLLAVKGIGPKKLKAMRKYLRL